MYKYLPFSTKVTYSGAPNDLCSEKQALPRHDFWRLCFSQDQNIEKKNIGHFEIKI